MNRHKGRNGTAHDIRRSNILQRLGAFFAGFLRYDAAPMNVLGLETSCDETGVAIFDSGRGLVGQALHSQIDLHKVYGGVVPEIAARDHIRRLLPMIRNVLEDTGVERPDAIDRKSVV